MIVLNPFLDSLYNFGLKNIGLTPGTGSGCFQSSQDTVLYYLEDTHLINLSTSIDSASTPVLCPIPEPPPTIFFPQSEKQKII